MAPQTQCPTCKAMSMESGVCLNPNCRDAQAAATADASRRTSKATAVADRPAAFSASGRVD